jgi:hypothetical protein
MVVHVPQNDAGHSVKQTGCATMKTDQEGGQSAAVVECIAYSPQGAAIATGRSRSRIFKAIKDKELVARKDGRATLLEADELRRWVRSVPTTAEAAVV